VKNGKCPNSAVVERMGSDSEIAQQVCAAVEGNFRNILTRAKILKRKVWLISRDRERNIAGLAVVITSTTDDYSQLLLKGEELAQKVRSHFAGVDLLLLLPPNESFVLGMVLATGESFSTLVTVKEFLNSQTGGIYSV
jgi:hypothetical protein